MGQQDRLPQRRFKGYSLVDGVPELHYQADGMDVYEKLTPVDGGMAIRREVRFGKVDGPVWFEGKLVTKGTNVKVEEKLAK